MDNETKAKQIAQEFRLLASGDGYFKSDSGEYKSHQTKEVTDDENFIIKIQVAHALWDEASKQVQNEGLNAREVDARLVKLIMTYGLDGVVSADQQGEILHSILNSNGYYQETFTNNTANQTTYELFTTKKDLGEILIKYMERQLGFEVQNYDVKIEQGEIVGRYRLTVSYNKVPIVRKSDNQSTQGAINSDGNDSNVIDTTLGDGIKNDRDSSAVKAGQNGKQETSWDIVASVKKGISSFLSLFSKKEKKKENTQSAEGEKSTEAQAQAANTQEDAVAPEITQVTEAKTVENKTQEEPDAIGISAQSVVLEEADFARGLSNAKTEEERQLWMCLQYLSSEKGREELDHMYEDLQKAQDENNVLLANSIVAGLDKMRMGKSWEELRELQVNLAGAFAELKKAEAAGDITTALGLESVISTMVAVSSKQEKESSKTM